MAELLEKYGINLMPFQDFSFNGDNLLAAQVLRLRDKYNLSTFVELGTCLGSTTRWAAVNFEKVITIEINPSFAAIAEERFLGLRNIELIVGDTVEVLPYIINKIPKNSFVFIDSHWTDNNPLLEELHILQHIKPMVMAIHDFKVPDHPELSYDEYPAQNIVYEWNYIKNHIKDYSYFYHEKAAENSAKRGVIFLISNG